jgi:amino acid permease
MESGIMGSLAGIWSKDMSVISNVVNAILGVSVFLVPWGFHMSGTVGGALIVCLLAFCSYQTCLAMITVQQKLLVRSGEVHDYMEVVTSCLGPAAGQIVAVATVISCMGASISYLIFLGRLLSSFFDVGFVSVLMMTTPFLLMLAWIRSFHELSIFAGLGTLFVLSTILLICFDNQTERSLSKLIAEAPLFDSQATSFLGPATFLFTVHYCVMAISSEALREKSATKSRIHSVLHLESSFSVPSTVSRVLSLDSPRPPPVIHSDGKDSDHTGSICRPLQIAYAVSSAIVIFHGITGMAVYRHQQ